ncbi:MAG: tetratricopeptide repeat protein, partial [Myxococcales bacterium]|nr:tetratricopeptide repeat protein [Myxococcales bacterium]
MRTRCVSLATRGVELIGLFVVVALALPASAQKSSSVDAELSKVEKAVSSLVAQPIKRDNVHSPTYFEERLADGELFYRLEDYTRAAIIFTDLVENHANHRAFPDALYLLADSLYMANDVVGARRRFEQVLQQASSNAAYRPYVQRSLGRLIEIAIRTRNFEGVEQYFGLVSQLAPAEVEAATAYYRGKFLYNRAVPVEDVLRADPKASAQPPMDLAQLDQARQAFESVKEGSPYYPQARYFIGVIHTLKREFPQAINAFLRVV